jgi:hypothetical protein
MLGAKAPGKYCSKQNPKTGVGTMTTILENPTWLCRSVLKASRVALILFITVSFLGWSGAQGEPTLKEDLSNLSARTQENVIAEVTKGRHTLTFIEVDGTVSIAEDAPASSVSVLDELAKHDATPLEVFEAFAVGEETPVALIKDHMIRHNLDGEASDIAAPVVRDLSFAMPALDGQADSHYYETDCSFAADGTYFDNWWQELGWNWHWYRYSTPDSNIIEFSATTPKRHQLRAHSCNNSDDWDPYSFNVWREESAGCSGEFVYHRTVEGGHRVVYVLSGAKSDCSYTLVVVNVYEVPHSLGIMVPPHGHIPDIEVP